MTKNEAIKNAVTNFMNQHVIASVNDLKEIEAELLKEIYAEFDSHNSIAIKDEKWRKPEYLDNLMISEIMPKVFSFRKIRCCPQNPEYSLLGVYVDDYVVSITGCDKNYGIYVTDDETIEKLVEFFNASIAEKNIKEVVSKIKRNANEVARCDDRDLIAVNNGVFNYKTKELKDFSPDYVFLTKSCVNYNPNAVSPVIKMPNGNDWDVESWMTDLNDDPEITNLFWEITSALLRPNVRWNKAAMLISDTGNNGKGTLVEMWRALLGDGTHCSIPLSDFSKDFMLEPLIRTSAVITDENDVGGYLDKAANLKAVITNDVVSINRKFKEPISYQVRGFMVQCLNEIPKIKDKSESFYRRQLYIPMTKCFTGIEIPEIKNDYLHRKDVLEYVMKKALETNFYKLSEPESCRLACEEYKEFNDPVRQFWNEFKDDFVWDLLPFKFLYALFLSWSFKNNPSGKPMSNSSFINDLLQILKNDENWICLDKAKQFYPADGNDFYGMTRPEHLIVDYDLKEWMSPTHKGKNKDLLATPTLDKRYRGLLRVNSANNADDK